MIYVFIGPSVILANKMVQIDGIFPTTTEKIDFTYDGITASTFFNADGTRMFGLYVGV